MPFSMHFVCLEDITHGAGIRSNSGQRFHALYFGGWSSLSSQPFTWPVFRGSGRSQSKHWNVRCPLPPGGSARIKKAPQPGQVGLSAWPIAPI
jgi:hypothetical protein